MASSTVSFNNLPREMHGLIAKYCDANSLLKLGSLNKKGAELSQTIYSSKALWDKHISKEGFISDPHFYFEKPCAQSWKQYFVLHNIELSKTLRANLRVENKGFCKQIGTVVASLALTAAVAIIAVKISYFLFDQETNMTWQHYFAPLSIGLSRNLTDLIGRKSKPVKQLIGKSLATGIVVMILKQMASGCASATNYYSELGLVGLAVSAASLGGLLIGQLADKILTQIVVQNDQATIRNWKIFYLKTKFDSQLDVE